MAMFTEPERSQSGLYVVDWDKNFVAWYAWREWLSTAFKKRFFPKFLTVPLPWPPSTDAGATLVGSNISRWRTEILEEDGRKSVRITRGGGWNAVPSHPIPWDEWSPAERSRVARLEASRRLSEDGSFDRHPKYPIYARNFHWRPEPQRYAATS